jgi:DNA-binding SARP family transcriptional activator
MGAPAAVLDDAVAAHVHTRAPEDEGSSLAPVEVRLLGGFEVRVDARPVTAGRWSRRHSVALVKLLSLTPGRSLHREQVIDALWPDVDPSDAAPRLHKAAHYARKALGNRDAVVLSGDTVRLYPHSEVHVDAALFQHAAHAALRDGGRAAAKAALTAHSGDLLPNDLYEPWTEQPRLHLGDLYTALLHQAEDWHQALAADPADETAHLALAQRYAGSGDRAAAVRQLDRLDQVMRDDLGLEPSGPAVALRQQLFAATSANTSSGDKQCCAQASGAAGHRGSIAERVWPAPSVGMRPVDSRWAG